MLTIDGSRGEGGGQMLRSALALSLVTGRAFRIENIRAGRSRPGLLRQHLCAVRAAAAIGGAAVEGAELGSRVVQLRPGEVAGGDYTFEIGSAGSVCLVLQAILPALLCARAPSRVAIEGGTHVPFAPVWDFLDRAYGPVLAKMGAKFEWALTRPGFMPAGGGRITLSVQPTPALAPLDLCERGETRARRARVWLAHLPRHIAERELEVVERALGFTRDADAVIDAPAAVSPGNVLVIELASDGITEVFSSIGERRVTAEAVARRAVGDVKRYLASSAPVGEYLADQLLLPLAIAGEGAFRTRSLTQHARTNIEVIEAFLPVRFGVHDEPAGSVRVDVARRSV